MYESSNHDVSKFYWDSWNGDVVLLPLVALLGEQIFFMFVVLVKSHFLIVQLLDGL